MKQEIGHVSLDGKTLGGNSDMKINLSNIQKIASSNKGEIYWNDGDFGECKRYMSLKKRRERIKRINQLEHIFFKELDNLNKDIYIIPYYNFDYDVYTWFEAWKDLTSSVYYKNIIKEANKNNIILKYTKVIPYKSNSELPHKFFVGNMNYISLASFIVPELKIIYYPTHNLTLKMFGEIKGNQNTKFIESILLQLTNSELWIDDNF